MRIYIFAFDLHKWLNLISKLFIVAILFILTSCTERKFTVYTIPENVFCEINGRQLGPSPITVKYVENGVFNIRLSQEGYEILNGKFKLKKKWFNLIGLDFIGEILPYRLIDHQKVEFTLTPIQRISHDEFKKKTDQLNNKNFEKK